MPYFIKRVDKQPYSQSEIKRLIAQNRSAFFEVTESHANQVLRRQDAYQEVPAALLEAPAEPQAHSNRETLHVKPASRTTTVRKKAQKV